MPWLHINLSLQRNNIRGRVETCNTTGYKSCMNIVYWYLSQVITRQTFFNNSFTRRLHASLPDLSRYEQGTSLCRQCHLFRYHCIPVKQTIWITVESKHYSWLFTVRTKLFWLTLLNTQYSIMQRSFRTIKCTIMQFWTLHDNMS